MTSIDKDEKFCILNLESLILPSLFSVFGNDFSFHLACSN